LDYTTRITIPSLELALGPYEALSVRGNAPVSVQVQYCYEPAEPDVHTLPNGDPGEPGCPAEFDFKRILTVESLVLASDDGDFRLLVKAGADLYKVMAISELDDIENAVMASRKFEADQARIDNAKPRRRGVLLGDRP
jgi:hypothetical protein